MKVLNVTINREDPNKLVVSPLGNRYYELAKDTTIRINTDVGSFYFFFKKGFKTNFRSGGFLVDGFIDQIGNTLTQVAYLCHDASYTPSKNLNMCHPLSRKYADELLKQMLVYAGMSNFKAGLVYKSVSLFGNSAYEEDDELTEENSNLFTFLWLAK